MAYSEESDACMFDLHLAERQDTKALVPLPGAWAGQTVHLWAGFTKEVPRQAPSTMYLGLVIGERGGLQA